MIITSYLKQYLTSQKSLILALNIPKLIGIPENQLTNKLTYLRIKFADQNKKHWNKHDSVA